MSANAYNFFWESAEHGELPAAVGLDGGGLVTAVVEYVSNPDARDIVLSGNPKERAVAAIFAIERALEYVDASEGLTAS